MSRTMHHVPWKHWNIKRPRMYAYGQWSAHNGEIEYDEQTKGHELYDLRFFAGCKREPQLIHRSRWDDSYVLTWGHHHAISEWAAIRHHRRRAEEHAFAGNVVKYARAGAPVDDLLEPEGRTRHSAVRDAL